MQNIAIVLRNGIRTNYGFLGLEFAKIVESIGTEQILAMHKEAVKSVYNLLINPNRLSHRVALKLASIFVTAKLIEQHFGCGMFNFTEVMNLLIKAEYDSRSKETLDVRALELFKEFAVTNRTKFAIYTDDLTKTPTSTLYGAITINNGICNLNVLKSAFKIFLEMNNIKERLTILRAWKAKGLIETEKDHGYDVHVSALSNRRAIRMKISMEEAKFFLPDINTNRPLRYVYGEPQAYPCDYDECHDIGSIFNGNNGSEYEN